MASRRVVGDGLGLTVVEFGGSEGPPLLCVHGAYCHARVWDFVIERLPPAWEIVAVDLPGHGDSETPANPGRYRFARLTDYLLTVVGGLREAPVLVGHSIGSALAMSFGIAHPRDAAGLVLLDIDPHPPRFQIDHLHDAGGKPPKRYPDRAGTVAREARVAPAAAPRVHELEQARVEARMTVVAFCERRHPSADVVSVAGRGVLGEGSVADPRPGTSLKPVRRRWRLRAKRGVTARLSRRWLGSGSTTSSRARSATPPCTGRSTANGLCLPVGSTGEVLGLAGARRETFVEPPTRRNRLWQADFVEGGSLGAGERIDPTPVSGRRLVPVAGTL